MNKIIKTILVVLVFFGYIGGSVAVSAADLLIESEYMLVDSKRINRVVFEYTYKAKITNKSSAGVSGAKATVLSNSPNTVIKDNQVSFSSIPAGATIVSSDTFSFQQNRTFPFNSNDIVWEITPTDNPPSTNMDIQQLEDEGAIPKLDRSSDLRGVDLNNNGIRDDVETYIEDNYIGTEQRAAAEQVAKFMQEAILVDATNFNAVRAIDLRGSKAINCIYAHFDESLGTTPPSRVALEIRAISTNTKARLLSYLAFDKALDGTVGSIPEGDTCE